MAQYSILMRYLYFHMYQSKLLTCRSLLPQPIIGLGEAMTYDITTTSKEPSQLDDLYIGTVEFYY